MGSGVFFGVSGRGRRRGIGAVAVGVVATMVALSGPSLAQAQSSTPGAAEQTDEAAGVGALTGGGPRGEEVPAPAPLTSQPPKGSEVESVTSPDDQELPPKGSEDVPDEASIVGGTAAPVGAYPFFVSVQTSGGGHFCGGSMISSIWVLTASHCVDGGVTPGSIRVVVGRTVLSDSSQGVVRNVAQIVLHPSWNPGTFQNDAALLRLDAAIPQNLRWTRLARGGDAFAPGNNLRVIGHGAVCEGCAGSNQLLQVDVPVQSDATMQSGSVYGASFDPVVMIGAGPLAGGQDSCQGDSGGPLFVNTGNQVPQVGVVSWGTGCARPNKPGVYAEMPAAALTNFVNANVPRPGNDSFAGFGISGATGSSFSSNANATSQAGEPSGGDTGVWYSWSAPASGPVTFNTRDSNFDTVLSVYTGNAVNALTHVVTNDDYGGTLQSKLSFNAVSGTSYRIRVRGFAAAWGNFGLQWAQNPPVNDDFGAATVLSGVLGNAAGNNTNSTGEPGEPAHAGGIPDRTVWWQWTAPESGSATINTRNSSFDTMLGVYTGGALNGLTPVGSNDDFGGTTQSKVNFTAVAGTVYRIAVDGFGGSMGSISLEWSVGRPANDDFGSAQVLSGATGKVTGTNARSTAEPGEPSHAGTVQDRTVWYRWTAPESGPATMNTRESDFDTVLAVYTGPGFGSLTAVASNDQYNGNQSRVAFTATAGTIYQIAVDGFGASTGSIGLQWTVNPPANDDFGSPQTLPGDAGDVAGTNVRATGEPGSPQFHGGAAADNSVWYSWTPSVTQQAHVRLTDLSSGLFPGIEAYTGTALTALTPVGTSGTEAVFNATAGTTYRIAVDANGGGVGTFTVRWLLGSLPGAPTGVAATVTSTTSASVSFTPPVSDGGNPISGYEALCESSDGGVPQSASGASSPIAVGSLTTGATYSCRVRAVNGVGAGPLSAPSASFVVALRPGAPQGVSATWLTLTTVSVAFSPPASDGGSAITNYQAQCTSSDGGLTRTKLGAASPLTVANLTSGATYQCRVRATNVIGYGPFSAFAPAQQAAPGVPGNVAAKWRTLTSITVTFTAPPTDGGSAITSYTAQCVSSDGGITRASTGAASPRTVSGLTAGATYDCRVRARNVIGAGAFSASVPAQLAAPSAPRAVSATPISSTSASVSFTEPAANGGSAITSYQAQCTSTNGGVTRYRSGAASPLQVNNLTTGSTYRCRVRATNAVGTGPYSAYSPTFVPSFAPSLVESSV